MWNSTEDPSSIRFGGINEGLIREDHELVWFNTTNSNAWSFEVFSAGIHINLAANSTMHVLVDPGYPYIAMPKHAFASYVDALKAEYPDDPLTCTGADWCYFFKPCSSLLGRMPDLIFEAKASDGKSVMLRVPPESFLFSDVDYATNLTTCHLGVIGQKYNDMDFWIVGQAFMENFYTVFDASDPAQPKIALSVRTYPPESAFPVVLAVCAFSILIMIIVVIAGTLCYRKRQEQRLKKAKTYFEQLQNFNHD